MIKCFLCQKCKCDSALVSIFTQLIILIELMTMSGDAQKCKKDIGRILHKIMFKHSINKK